jgi:hypothetical protein
MRWIKMSTEFKQIVFILLLVSLGDYVLAAIGDEQKKIVEEQGLPAKTQIIDKTELYPKGSLIYFYPRPPYVYYAVFLNSVCISEGFTHQDESAFTASEIDKLLKACGAGMEWRKIGSSSSTVWKRSDGERYAFASGLDPSGESTSTGSPQFFVLEKRIFESFARKINDHVKLGDSKDRVEELYGKPLSQDKDFLVNIPYFTYSRGPYEIDIYYGESIDIVQAIDFRKLDGKFSEEEIQDILSKSRNNSDWVESRKLTTQEMENAQNFFGKPSTRKDSGVRTWKRNDQKAQATLSELHSLSLESAAYLWRVSQQYRKAEQELKDSR